MSRRLPGKLVLGLVAALVAVELALHLAPGLLPRAYRARFPMLGVEFFHPGILERTPIEGLPLPLPSSAHRGPPPADLVEFGVAPADAGADARAYPAVELDCDALGFPNERVLEQADLVLVGDSFGVAAGVRVPRGLQLGLAEATRLVVYNASVAGIGPVQERWLVEHVALARKPRAVLWLFFSGNDLTASYEPYLHRREGRTTWAEAYADRRKPTLYLVDLLRWRFAGHGTPPCPSPLPAFAFPLAHGTRASLWLHPDYLRQLAWTRAQWEEHPVWAVVKDDLRAAREACRAAGSRLVLVYLPSTPEVLLPQLERDPELALRTAAAFGAEVPTSKPDELYELLLANRHALEDVVEQFCESESIPFFSATGALEAQAARGELGFLTTDTHWSPAGQTAVVEPLVEFLRAQGVAE